MDEFKKETDHVVTYKQIFENVDIGNRKTKIACQLGPSCWDVDMLEKIIDAGCDIAVINLNNGTREVHVQAAENTKVAVMQKPGRLCSIMVNMSGFELMINPSEEVVILTSGEQIMLHTDVSKLSDDKGIACNYSKSLHSCLEVGQVLLIDNGALKLEVSELDEDNENCVTCVIKNDYKLTKEEKNIRFPTSTLDIPCLSEQDKDDFANFVLKSEIDFISVPSIRKASDVESLKEMIKQAEANVQLFARITNHEALQNFDEILLAADGIIIDRKQLQTEIPIEKVLIAQKWMIEKANIASKSIMISSQTFESMSRAARPSRGEAADISLAVTDGIDVVMVGEETASGDFPVPVVNCLCKIMIEAEKNLNNKKVLNDLILYTPTPICNAESIAQTVCQTIPDHKNCNLIITITQTGKVAKFLTKYRPSQKILAAAPDKILRQLSVNRGILGFYHPDIDSENAIKYMIEEAKDRKLCKIGQKVAIVTPKDEDTEIEQNDFQLVMVS